MQFTWLGRVGKHREKSVLLCEVAFMAWVVATVDEIEEESESRE